MNSHCRGTRLADGIAKTLVITSLWTHVHCVIVVQPRIALLSEYRFGGGLTKTLDVTVFSNLSTFYINNNTKTTLTTIITLFNNTTTPVTVTDGCFVTTSEVSRANRKRGHILRLAVYLWLSRIDERLPSHVQRVYAHELSIKTLKDLQPQLCRSMDALLVDIEQKEDIQVNYTRSSSHGSGRSRRHQHAPASLDAVDHTPSHSRSCLICKAAGRTSEGHDVAGCWYVSKYEKNEVARMFRENEEVGSGDE